ncbi:kinase family with ARM repeat domain-containing protein isoform X2 [Wolffia australiana]
MFKFLKGVVAGSGSGIKDLPYNVGEPYSTAWGSWTHFRGTSKDDGSPVSIFSLSGSSAQDGHIIAGRNGVKRLRTVRHPNILSFLHSTEVEADTANGKHVIYIVTEPVIPLSEKIKELGLQGSKREEYYAWGLHQISKAVSFLNNDCKLIHGNVCLTSVVVTQTLDWKLHAFDVLSEFEVNSEAGASAMLQFEWLIGSQYKPMELLKSDWQTIRKSPPWAIDSWGLGCLIYEIFSGLKLAKTEDLRDTSAIPKSLLPDYQRLLSSNPSRRLNPAKLIDNGEYFHNKLVETIQFMEILNLKDSVEKDSFFRKLPNLAEQLPRQIVLKKLLPLLSSALEFGSATASALAPVLKMGSWLPSDEFNGKVLPTVVKLFASNDRAIRVGLLQHLDQFGESLSAQIVDEQVFSHVATGFSDTSAFLRELTLKSMLILAPKLSQRTLTGSLLKYLSKLQVDEEPAIRTNTTILLSNIASYLNEGTRKRVLINAFTIRALRDTFSPARAAGVMALTATASYYDMTEIATRILPSIVVLIIDPDSDVRTKALQAIDQFLQISKQYHEKMNSGDSHETSAVENTLIPVNTSLLGWAMSSFTAKGKTPEHGVATSIKSETPVAPAGSNTGSANKISDLTDHPAPPSPTSTDGWADAEQAAFDEDHRNKEEEGWDDVEPLEDFKPPSAPSAIIQAAQKRPVVNSASSARAKPRKSTSSTPEEDDDLWGSAPVPPVKLVAKSTEDDPWASIAVPAPKTSSKPLTGPRSSVSAASVDESDPWAAIAAAPPTTRVKPLALGRGAKTKAAAPTKLGAQRIERNSGH